jgi:hypothetical protein
MKKSVASDTAPAEPELAPEPFPPHHHPAVPLLNEAEALCLSWGGDIGNKLRDLICKARDLL